MRTRVMLAAATCIASSLIARPLHAQAAARLREYRLDPSHSFVEFAIPFAFSRVKGRFTRYQGTILYDEARPANSSATIVIDAHSIDTSFPLRDDHLRTSDFFDVEKYPTIRFQSERLVPQGDSWMMSGTLTMHGVTRAIAIPFRLLHPPLRSPESNWMVLDAAAALRLARADFGILGGGTFNSWFDKARAATMGDSVDVTLEIEAWNNDAQGQRIARVEAILDTIRASGVRAEIDRLAELKRTRPGGDAGIVSRADYMTRALIATGRLNDAVALGRAFTEMYPTSTRAAAVYGLALSIAGNDRAAAREFGRMKEIFTPPVRDPNEKYPIDDDTWWYLDLLARTAVEWGFARHALPLARTVAELYPTTARAPATLGFVLAAVGDTTGAAAAYARALAVDPNETRALEWRRRLP